MTPLVPLTVNMIRRPFNRVACPVRHALAHVWYWSNRRRADQVRARTSHYKRRHHKGSLQYLVDVSFGELLPAGQRGGELQETGEVL
ncbi:hypothetical protein R3Q24_26840, partial [Rhodococcus ruber]|nr:hypothetical protein [Rhodococcus ruber]